MDLSFFDVSDDLIEKMTLLYPENRIIYSLKAENYLHQNELVNAAKTNNKYLVEYHIKRDQNDPISTRIASFYYLSLIHI